MDTKSIGTVVERIGGYLMAAGGITIAAIFILVMLNGTWPDFLSSVQTTAQLVSSYVGDLVWLVWVAVFVGPGWLVQYLGSVIRSRS